MKLLLASAPSYGKVHNVVLLLCLFLTLMTSKKSKNDLWIF